MNVILLGPPGSGKGTQGALLSERVGLPRVSTGDLLRSAVERGTVLGQEAQHYMDQGLLVPDEVILGLIEEVLAWPEAAGGIVMDGFPRTVAQAEAVERLLADRGARVDYVISIDVPEEELVRRMLGRAKQEGRDDDTPETIRQRFVVYREQTAPLIAFYRERGMLTGVSGIGSIEEIAGRVQEAVGR
ncbi:MAG: adenylate kinase [Gemmatimonadales bacterium]|nr:adenylate kinase [Gemmatimonadales bacterium]NIN48616.1 adenylate kinase [Gemmatimonadales bacterium]NIP06080.1 adenylate kinase [Gemmatimonadales bacterium]NIR01254.1 adenylate kinase [Gemmatimonadales bacterium]